MKKTKTTKRSNPRQLSIFDRPAKRKSVRSTSKRSNPRKNINAYGADDVYTTKNSIAVRRSKGKIIKNGQIVYVDRTVYYPKTDKNMRIVERQCGKIRAGRK